MTALEAPADADVAGAGGEPEKPASSEQPRVLWSPNSKRAREGASSAAGDGSRASDAGGSSRGRPSLSSLAKSFKQTFGEEIGEGGGDGDGGHMVEAQPMAKRTRARGGSAALEVAETMSPEKLASEVQKARARAREERFGGAARQVAAGAGARLVGVGSRPTSTSTSTSTKTRTSGGSAEVDGRTLGASRNKQGSPPPGTQTSGDDVKTSPPPSVASEPSPRPAELSDGEAARVAEPPETRGESDVVTPSSVTPLSPGLAVPTVNSSSSVATVAPAPAMAKGEPLVESIPANATRAAQEHGGSSATGKVPAKPADAASSEGVPEKVHTLRLRMRADMYGTSNRGTDDGVEESKGFDPPNADGDGGSEESKGSEPPNLLPGPTRTPSPCVPSGPVPSDPPATSPATPPAEESVGVTAESGSSHAGSGTRGPLPIPGQPSVRVPWGPCFSVPRPAVAVAASPTPVPSATTNPWVLSSSAPTFSRNRGRPLASSFSEPVSRGALKRRVETPQEMPNKRGRPDGSQAGHSGATGGDLTASEGDPESALDPGARGYRRLSSRGAGAAGRCPGTVGESEADELGGGRRLSVCEYDGPSGDRDDLQGSRPAESRDKLIIDWNGEDEVVPAEEDPAPVDGEDTVLGVRVTGAAKDLLERLKREREESMDLERKLTQALLDL